MTHLNIATAALVLSLSLIQAAVLAQESQPRIQVHETIVFDGNKGWQHNGVTYRLACGACIAEMPNGDLLCWWLSGSDSEPATDNNVLAARSTDKGKTWSEPYILVEAGRDASALTAMHTTPDGRVIAFSAAVAFRASLHGVALLSDGINRQREDLEPTATFSYPRGR